MVGNDLISVIVPVYNVEKYLHKCINSIINQTYKNIEIILIDDGSTDHSGKICDEYRLIDSRIRVVHKNNGGLSSARNAGIDICSGKYIAFVDGDDYIAEDMYEYLYNNRVEKGIVACGIADDFKYEIVYSHKDGIVEFNNIESIQVYLDLQLSIYNKKNNVGISHNIGSSFNNKLFDRILFKNIRFPEGFINEDNMIILELLYLSQRVKSLPRDKYFYVKHLGSITQKNFNNKSFHLVNSRIIQEKQVCKYIPEMINKAKLMTLLACDNTLVKISNISMNERKKFCSEIEDIKLIISDRKDIFSELNWKSKFKINWFMYNSSSFFFVFYIRLKFIKLYKKFCYFS